MGFLIFRCTVTRLLIQGELGKTVIYFASTLNKMVCVIKEARPELIVRGGILMRGPMSTSYY